MTKERIILWAASPVLLLGALMLAGAAAVVLGIGAVLVLSWAIILVKALWPIWAAMLALGLVAFGARRVYELCSHAGI
jgi:hypothetical protein